MKFGFSPLVVSNTSVNRVMVFFCGFKYSSVVQQVHLNLKWAHYKFIGNKLFIGIHRVLKSHRSKMSITYMCYHENNVPSRLSPKWLCGNSCTWAS